MKLIRLYDIEFSLNFQAIKKRFRAINESRAQKRKVIVHPNNPFMFVEISSAAKNACILVGVIQLSVTYGLLYVYFYSWQAGQVYGVPLADSQLSKPGVFPELKHCGEELRKKWIEVCSLLS